MKLWGGRFTDKTDDMANSFHASIGFDKKLYRQDINGSIAHAQMLGKQKIIPQSETKAIVGGLKQILADIDSGVLFIDMSAEDIHSFVETELIARIGEAGKKLHTGRSRNDQVSLDMRMYVKKEIDFTAELIVKLLKTLVILAKIHVNDIMPGFTHLQKAQPVTLAHHLMAYFQMFRRDYGRFMDCRGRTDTMPLGSGALAGTTFPLDRDFIRKKLDFEELTSNSMDAVSDRDFCIEYVSCLSLVMMHLSRFCEELILWSTDSFAFVSISDSYSTGSSIMPQKKNPDMAELVRGKTGRVYGSLMGLLTMMKGLPLAYNKDMQEDKEAVFDASDTVKNSLAVFTGMLQSITFNTGAMYEAALGAYSNATDAADWLVKKGLSFREAHEITGRLVLYAIEKSKKLDDLTIAEFKDISPVFDDTIYHSISIRECVNARSIKGGPASSAVLEAVKQGEKFLASCRKKQ